MSSMATLPRIHPVILAGGSGVRLWPLSRPWHPKPFVRLAGDHTLLQATAARLSAAQRFAPPLVICNRTHRFLVGEQLHQIGIEPQAIVLEPEARNTAPAACIAALLLAERQPDALVGSSPSALAPSGPRLATAISGEARVWPTTTAVSASPASSKSPI